MISHEHKCIFIHIPKTAGMSIYNFFYPDVRFYQDVPNYDILFGWCPKRKLHMQHATAKQLLETNLVTETQWKTYYKFTFVRNPWDRAYSDYKWIQEFSKIKGSFKSYINKEKEFEKILNDATVNTYLGDHLIPQCEFFDLEGFYKLDTIGRFENFSKDIAQVLHDLSIKRSFDYYINKSKRIKDYSKFYSNTNKNLVEQKFKEDILTLGYKFDDNRTGIYKLKKYL